MTNSAARVPGACTLKPRISLKSVSPLLPPKPKLLRKRFAAIHALSVQGNPAAESVLRFTGVKDALLSAPRVLTPAAAFLQLEGAANANVIVDGGDLSKTTSTVALKAGATRAAVKVRT